MKKIGFVGLGTMGAGMVKNMAKNGLKVLAYNRTKKNIPDIYTVDNLEEPAEADIIFVCVPDDAAVEEVFKGLGLKPGKILIDCSTTSVELTERMAKECEEKDIKFLDAPITGSKRGAENGTLTFMVGGERETYDECLPILMTMGKSHIYCGPHTYGQKAKIALNLTQALILESYLEGIILAVKNGLSLEAIQEVMENSAAKSGIGTVKLESIKQRDFTPHFMLKLMYKDLKLADNEIRKLGIHLPLSERISEIFEKSLNRETEDFSAIVKELENESGVVLKSSSDVEP